jgi:hypothetical protein
MSACNHFSDFTVVVIPQKVFEELQHDETPDSVPVGTLTISMIEPALKTTLMSAACLAPLCNTSSETTGMAAITMPPVTVGTDEEHGVAIGRHAELLRS